MGESNKPEPKVLQRREFLQKGALAGAAGAVWRRENALSCCISSGIKFSLSHRENQSRS